MNHGQSPNPMDSGAVARNGEVRMLWIHVWMKEERPNFRTFIQGSVLFSGRKRHFQWRLHPWRRDGGFRRSPRLHALTEQNLTTWPQDNIPGTWTIYQGKGRTYTHFRYTLDKQNLARVNRIRPTAVAGTADIELTLSASACLIGGPNSVSPGQFCLSTVPKSHIYQA